jgi:hypothetical protein
MPELDSAVGTATGYGLDDRGVGVRVAVGTSFSLFHSAHPAFYPMDTARAFPECKAVGA